MSDTLEAAAAEAYEVYTAGLTSTRWENADEATRTAWRHAIDGAIAVWQVREEHPNRVVTADTQMSKSTLYGEEVLEVQRPLRVTIATDGMSRPQGVFLNNVDVSRLVSNINVEMSAYGSSVLTLEIHPDEIQTVDTPGYQGRPLKMTVEQRADATALPPPYPTGQSVKMMEAAYASQMAMEASSKIDRESLLRNIGAIT